jgi:translation initiation factor 3 subunit B
MENGYNIWSSHGRLVGHVREDKFYQFLWRPRPPSLLPDAKEKEIRRNLREYSKKYEAQDAVAKRSLQGDKLKQRQQKHRAFEAFLEQKAQEYKELRQARIDLRGGAESDNESAYTFIEDVDEVELSFKEEIMPPN